MLKKIFLFGLLTVISSFSFAGGQSDSTLYVAPYNPDDWGYMYATVVDANHPVVGVGNGVTLPVAINDTITLTVYAMNAKPKLAESCQNIQIREAGAHKLLFELGTDWLVHCTYS